MPVTNYQVTASKSLACMLGALQIGCCDGSLCLLQDAAPPGEAAGWLGKVQFMAWTASPSWPAAAAGSSHTRGSRWQARWNAMRAAGFL